MALIAQSAWLDAVDHVCGGGEHAGQVRTPAFALTRPPGHHALKARGMGFCLFNFAVVAADHAFRQHGIKRIAMLDWDVHHGNGVADLVRDDERIR